MFQRKIDEISKGLPNIFSIVDNIISVGCDSNSADHNRTL